MDDTEPFPDRSLLQMQWSFGKCGEPRGAGLRETPEESVSEIGPILCSELFDVAS
jgi:hypothetical protein